MVRISVRAQPGAARDRVVGKVGDDWKLAVKAPPADGKANRALIELLAALCGAPASHVALRSGGAGRRKVFEVEGLDNAEIERRLAAAVD
jgi:uncharacterized protein